MIRKDEARKQIIPYSLIPRWVWKKVSPRALQLYVVLADMADRSEQTCFPSIRYLADEMRCSPSHVKRAQAELVEAGAIKVESRFFDGRQTSNLYTVIQEQPGGSPVKGEGLTSDTLRGSPLNHQEQEPSNNNHLPVSEDERAHAVSESSSSLPIELGTCPLSGKLEREWWAFGVHLAAAQDQGVVSSIQNLVLWSKECAGNRTHPPALEDADLLIEIALMVKKVVGCETMALPPVKEIVEDATGWRQLRGTLEDPALWERMFADCPPEFTPCIQNLKTGGMLLTNRHWGAFSRWSWEWHEENEPGWSDRYEKSHGLKVVS